MIPARGKLRTRSACFAWAFAKVADAVVGMTLNKIVPNRDEISSTHIFMDMDSGNYLAFFDFPKRGPARRTFPGWNIYAGTSHDQRCRKSGCRCG